MIPLFALALSACVTPSGGDSSLPLPNGVQTTIGLGAEAGVSTVDSIAGANVSVRTRVSKHVEAGGALGAHLYSVTNWDPGTSPFVGEGRVFATLLTGEPDAPFRLGTQLTATGRVFPGAVGPQLEIGFPMMWQDEESAFYLVPSAEAGFWRIGPYTNANLMVALNRSITPSTRFYVFVVGRAVLAGLKDLGGNVSAGAGIQFVLP